MTADRTAWNVSRFVPGDPAGFYESYFQRANHPDRPQAFWIRYTAFRPRGRPDEACAELWAIYFDGETRRIRAAKETLSSSECDFSRRELQVRIGDAILTDRSLNGKAASPSHLLHWALEYAGNEPPLLLLPEPLYERGFPKAKALVGTPNAIYNGALTVDGETIAIEGWKGSQNHNWGSQHTDRYAWGQVAGFDNAPDVFLECATAQVKLGPVWSPPLTFVVLRAGGHDIKLNSLMQAVRASGRFTFVTWDIDTRGSRAHISGRIFASTDSFVGLRYQNPPGGDKTCLNTKLASAEVTIKRPGHPPLTLLAKHRAAFEILTDRADHGVPIVA